MGGGGGVSHYIPTVIYQGNLSTMKGVHCPPKLRKYMKPIESKVDIYKIKSLLYLKCIYL